LAQSMGSRELASAVFEVTADDVVELSGHVTLDGESPPRYRVALTKPGTVTPHTQSDWFGFSQFSVRVLRGTWDVWVMFDGPGRDGTFADSHRIAASVDLDADQLIDFDVPSDELGREYRATIEPWSIPELSLQKLLRCEVEHDGRSLDLLQDWQGLVDADGILLGAHHHRRLLHSDGQKPWRLVVFRAPPDWTFDGPTPFDKRFTAVQEVMQLEPDDDTPERIEVPCTYFEFELIGFIDDAQVEIWAKMSDGSWLRGSEIYDYAKMDYDGAWVIREDPTAPWRLHVRDATTPVEFWVRYVNGGFMERL